MRTNIFNARHVLAFLSSLLILIIMACSTTPKNTESQTEWSPESNREPASFCRPTADDVAAETRIMANPAQYEEKRQILMKAQVQIYMIATELTYRFDRMLDQHVPLKTIYSSDTYMQLLGLQEVRRTIRHDLETFFAAKLHQTIGTNPTMSDRTAGIQRIVDMYEKEFQEVVHSKPDSRFARMALLDIAESFEDLRLYYVSCQYTDLHRAFEERMTKRKATLREIESTAPFIENAYKDFAPKPGEQGVDAYKLVKAAGDEIRNQVLIRNVRLPQGTQKIEPSVGPNGNIFGDAFPKKTWALTFDDGPGSTTAKVLDNLKKDDVKATFFMLSQQLKDPAYLKVAHRVQSEGHAIASHSMTHAQIPKLDDAGRRTEIIEAKKVFTNFFSKNPNDTPPKFFRLPYGAGVSVPTVRKMIADAGMIHVYWNVDTLDWQDHDPHLIFERAVKQIEQLDHGIILFHDIHSQSVIASELLMRYLKDPAKKIRMVTIPEITEELNRESKDATTTTK